MYVIRVYRSDSVLSVQTNPIFFYNSHIDERFNFIFGVFLYIGVTPIHLYRRRGISVNAVRYEIETYIEFIEFRVYRSDSVLSVQTNLIFLYNSRIDERFYFSFRVFMCTGVTPYYLYRRIGISVNAMAMKSKTLSSSLCFVCIEVTPLYLYRRR